MFLASCALRGPEGIELARAPVLGAVLTTDDMPRMLVLYDVGVDERGMRKVEVVDWDDAPGARSLLEERFLARARN